MNRKGLLIIVSGFSGAGKGTLMQLLLERYEEYALSVSATTRAPRAGECHGEAYFFTSHDEFEQMIREDALIEYARYVDNYYGTPKEYVLEQMNRGKDVILEIEIQGAIKVKERFPEAVLLFIMPPNAAELKNRLLGRGTESPEVIAARLKRAVEESDGIENYDYILVNDDIDTCVSAMHELIKSQHSKVSNNLPFVKQIKEELKTIAGGI